MHGTGVSTILVGGNPGLTRLVGVAPGADLVLADDHDTQYSMPLLSWALQQHPAVVLHEFVQWTGVHMDGSTNLEAAMDQAAAQGVPQVVPAGNIARQTGKHMVASISGGQTLDATVQVSGGSIGFVNATFHWQDPSRDLSFQLESPTGEVIDLGTQGVQTSLQDGTSVAAYRDDSPRGSAMFDIYFYKWNGRTTEPLATGQWVLHITDPSDPTDATGMELSGFVRDDKSMWGSGAHFTRNVSEKHLVCYPATADSAITVAAYAGRKDENVGSWYPEEQGQIREWSCRGTRIDGVDIMDIAAPDNPISATATDSFFRLDVPYPSVMEFGGTSGAGPHVAGAALLAKQAHPDWDGLRVLQAIRDGALVDEDVTSDGILPAEDIWGAGKLRVYEAVFGEPMPEDSPPEISAQPIQAQVGDTVHLSVQVHDAEDDPSALTVSWDLDYDGRWDVDVPATDALDNQYAEPGTYFHKARVTDSAGNTAATLVQVVVQPRQEEPDGGTTSPDGGLPGDAGTADASEPSGGGCHCTSVGAPAPTFPIALLVAVLLLRKRRRRTP